MLLPSVVKRIKGTTSGKPETVLITASYETALAYVYSHAQRPDRWPKEFSIGSTMRPNAVAEWEAQQAERQAA